MRGSDAMSLSVMVRKAASGPSRFVKGPDPAWLVMVPVHYVVLPPGGGEVLRMMNIQPAMLGGYLGTLSSPCQLGMFRLSTPTSSAMKPFRMYLNHLLARVPRHY